MAYNEKLASRVRELITATQKKVEEKQMFMGLCFMVNDKMCMGVHSDEIMVRVGPESAAIAVSKEGCTQMKMKNRVMQGYVLVKDEALKTKKQLDYWVQLALEFNKVARPSRKKTNKKR